jgi:hypothetical protein
MSGQTKLLLPSGGSLTIAGQNSASNNTVVLPANSGTVITTASTAVVSQAMLGAGVAGNGPAFSAYQSSAQTLSSSTTTKIQFQTELFDTNNNFDNITNYRFTPTVAGYYQVNAVMQAAISFTGGTIYLYKNGSQFATGMAVNAGGGTFVLSQFVQMNGTTDYIEIYGNIGTGQALAVATSFQAFLARSA